MLNLTPLEQTIFRGALALAFTDGVTGHAVTGGLRVEAYRFDPLNLQPVRRIHIAQSSPASHVYGFRTLPGLERYQRGEDLAPGSLSYLVFVRDEKQRYLPHLQQFELPFATPAVQEITLYPSPTYIAPAGYGLIRGSLLETTSPPDLHGVAPARQARITVTVPASNPGDPDVTYQGMADRAGQFLMCVSYPVIASNILLTEAEWPVDITIQYQPDSYRDELNDLRAIVPTMADVIVPLQTTLNAQVSADVATVVNVMDAETQHYSAVNVTGSPITRTLAYGRTLSIRTEIDSTADDLSELLVIPA